MKIVRKENGNILLTDASGNTIKRLPEYAVLELKSDTEGQYIRAAYGHQNKHDIYVSQITATQIEPDAEVAFSGTGQDLLNLLSTTFFFEVVGGGGYIYVKDRQSLVSDKNPNASFSTASTGNLISHIILPLANVEIDQAFININSGAVGSAVVSIYDIGSDGTPNNLLAQTGEFDTSITGLQSMPISIELDELKEYAVAFTISAASLGIALFDKSNMIPFFGENVRYSTPFVYNSTMPSIFPAGTYSVLQSIATTFNLI